MLHSRKSFAKLCGITENQLAVYIGRQKVVETDKKIDDTLPENAGFMEKKKERDGLKSVKVIVKPPMTKKEEAEVDKRIIEIEKQRKLNTGRKELELSKMEEEIEILKVKREKLHGILIPTELVKTIFAQHFKQIVVSFQQGSENLIIEISKKKS